MKMLRPENGLIVRYGRHLAWRNYARPRSKAQRLQSGAHHLRSTARIDSVGD